MVSTTNAQSVLAGSSTDFQNWSAVVLLMIFRVLIVRNGVAIHLEVEAEFRQRLIGQRARNEKRVDARLSSDTACNRN
jgi:hypothetical protein